MAKEPAVHTAPWAGVERALDEYEVRARRWRGLSYLLHLGLALSGLLALLAGFPDGVLLMIASLLPRMAFALWALRSGPRCPGCQGSLGWDFRGSPRRTRKVRRELSCPECGIPFVGE